MEKMERKTNLETDILEFVKNESIPTKVASLLEIIHEYGVAKNMGELTSLPCSKVLMFQYAGKKTLGELNEILKRYELPPMVNINDSLFYKSGWPKYSILRKIKLEKKDLFRGLEGYIDKDGNVRKVRGYVRGDFKAC